MNSELLKRIVRAIGEQSPQDLDQLALKIIEEERARGHTRIADQLEALYRSSKPKPKAAPARRGMVELPSAKRGGELLATLHLQDELEHHMVLESGVEARFARIEREYTARERLGVFGLRPRKTVLLYGPPGCGKSLGAQRIAWNTGLPLLKVRFDAILSSYFGESASNLRTVFEAAKARPCVLLMDECDFIARSRTAGRDIGEASRIVNALLLLMDEFDAPGLLVATTNIESALDAAIFRRFDEVFLVPKPGAVQIDQLLRSTLAALDVERDFDWPCFVKALDGVSAAEVVKVARDAAKSAVLSGNKIVTAELLDSAIQDLRRTPE